MKTFALAALSPGLTLLTLCLFLLPSSASAEQLDTLNDIHFLIPAGPGGGWDGTARGMGEAMLKSGLVANVSYRFQRRATVGQNTDTVERSA